MIRHLATKSGRIGSSEATGIIVCLHFWAGAPGGESRKGIVPLPFLKRDAIVFSRTDSHLCDLPGGFSGTHFAPTQKQHILIYYNSRD